MVYGPHDERVTNTGTAPEINSRMILYIKIVSYIRYNILYVNILSYIRYNILYILININPCTRIYIIQ